MTSRCLVDEKSSDPRWGLPGFTIQQDPRSRYFENYSLDRPPMPEDDPVSHQYMHRVDGMRAWPHWGRDGIRATLDNPQWRQRLPEYVSLDAQGSVKLDLPTALRLAYMHSPDHQSQLETIYLSALDVSTERFRLQTQFYGGNDTFIAHEGRKRGPGGEVNRLTTDTDMRLERAFATAGELLVGFANSFVWQFAGPDTYASASIVNVALVQPLLRNAGRSIALEQLTIVERGLLSNLRAYQRYRQGFFTRIAIGESGVSGPQRRGGFFGGTGLTGFTGTGAGGLGGVGAVTGFGRGGFAGGAGGAGGGGAGFAGGGAGQVGGFLGLLQASQEIRNTEVSLESMVRTLSLLEANLEAGIIDLTQVDQFRQNIETERATLLQSRNGLTNGVESYLTGTLGLPPDVPVTLDDSLVRQFQFIDARTGSGAGVAGGTAGSTGRIHRGPGGGPDRTVLRHRLTAFGRCRGGGADHAAGSGKCESTGRHARADDDAAGKVALRKGPATAGNLAGRPAATIGTDASAPGERCVKNATPDTRREALDELVTWLRELLGTVQELSLVQARARVEAIAVEPIGLDAANAFRIALTYRLDIMNNRAALVDSWRLIQFNAKRLQSDLQIVVDGDIRTLGDNPFRFRGPTGRVRAGVQFDPPFTRLLERNSYRQQLIEYQQDRRQLIQFYDGVHLSMRQLLRDMQQLQVNLEIQRRAVVIAIRRVDLTREELNEPTPPPQPGQPASQLGPTAALNLLTALSDLRSTQNNFMSVWLNYYADRMRLMRDLGLMQLDEQGNWVDVPLDEALACGFEAEEVELPPAIPDEWMRQAFENTLPPTPPAAQPQIWSVDARSRNAASQLWSR